VVRVGRDEYLDVVATKQNHVSDTNKVRYPILPVTIDESFWVGGITAATARTIVVDTRIDPFGMAGVDRARVIRDIQLASMLFSIDSSPDPMPVSRIRQWASVAAYPCLLARTLIKERSGYRPKGWGPADISERVLELVAETPPLLVESAGSTPTVTRYELTAEGNLQLARLRATYVEMVMPRND